MDVLQLCPKCHSPTNPTYFFCPTCGTKLKEKPLNLSFVYQIYLYAFALILPPLGLWPAVKYLRSPDTTARKIGLVLIALTVVSTVVTTWYAVKIANQVSADITKQLNQYNNMGL
ncbi:hypothetical protein A2Z00_04910 [Candidatus Gottesmanbacteria bacterium RBG_13_45_10]|uniref:Uncharacterized protein n=1 Tax=Candidatus Gottesmanbacteria bacterium RBG_13_45_10 TaxID=1798370 RepID=A0A1F5ZGI9_9BACT|nr:MAG: hypothetical protein A2Z00_04910 [Candidatus Gottesmanbacteria bacterium RBG_13_45_10]